MYSAKSTIYVLTSNSFV